MLEATPFEIQGMCCLQVQGFVHDKSGAKIATLLGKWDEAMYYVMGDVGEKHKSYDPMSDAVQLWRRADPPVKMTRYGLTAFAITLNELTPGLKVCFWLVGLSSGFTVMQNYLLSHLRDSSCSC